MQFTDTAIRAFRPPDRGYAYYWDEKLRGLGIRISSEGTRTFVVLIASGRRKTIGRYPAVPLALARKEAGRMLAEKALGVLQPKRTAFDDAKADFLDDCEKRLKPRTVADYKRLLGRHFQFGRKAIADITPYELVRIFNGLNETPAEKYHAFTAGRALFRWCQSQHLVEKSPMERMRIPAHGVSRDRVLTPKELRSALALALAGRSPFDAIVSLLILTGQRRGEIAALQWDWIDGDLITLPARLTKNGREHAFPVGAMTLQVLENIIRFKDSPYLFPAARSRFKDRPATIFNGWGKPKADFDKKLGIAPWTLHDLRRTLRTEWARLRISREVAERYINHVSGAHAGIVGVYDRYSYLDDMRDAVSRWEMHLQGILQNNNS